jgi:hypothetical protein
MLGAMVAVFLLGATVVTAPLPLGLALLALIGHPTGIASLWAGPRGAPPVSAPAYGP